MICDLGLYVMRVIVRVMGYVARGFWRVSSVCHPTCCVTWITFCDSRCRNESFRGCVPRKSISLCLRQRQRIMMQRPVHICRKFFFGAVRQAIGELFEKFVRGVFGTYDPFPHGQCLVGMTRFARRGVTGVRVGREGLSESV